MCLRIHWHHLLGLCPPWCNFNNVINPSFVIWIFACLGSLGKNPPDWCISFWISNHWNLDVKVTLTFALVPNGHIFLWKAEMPLEFSGHWERNLTRGLSLIILHLWWPVHLVASGMGAFDSSAFISYSRFFVVHRWASICFASRFTYRNSLSLWGWSGQEKGSWVWEAATYIYIFTFVSPIYIYICIYHASIFVYFNTFTYITYIFHQDDNLPPGSFSRASIFRQVPWLSLYCPWNHIRQRLGPDCWDLKPCARRTK